MSPGQIVTIAIVKNGIPDEIIVLKGTGATNLLQNPPYEGFVIGPAADKVFADIVRKFYPNVLQDDIECALDDGYYSNGEVEISIFWPQTIYS